MAKPLRTLSGLIDFESAARLGSFRMAAEELNKTPAAVSQQIKQLEEELEFVLFLRHPRHVTLTVKGEQFARSVGAMLGELRAKVLALRARDDDSTLNVSTGHSVAMKWLVPRLHEFTHLHPEIDVRVHASDEIVNLEDGEFDIALRTSQLAGHPEEEIVYREKLLAVCSPALLAEIGWREGPPPLRVLLQLPVIFQDSPRCWLDLMAQEGITDSQPNFGRKYSHMGLMVQAAVAGLGVALAPSSLAFEDVLRGQLVIGACPPIYTGDGYRLLYGRNRGAVPKIRAFRDWFAQEALRVSTL